MSFVRNYQAEDRNLNGGYWPTYDGNNTDRKKSRNHYDQRNYNNYYDNQTNFGYYGGNFNQCNADHASYADVVPSSQKKRKFSGPVGVESQKFNLPATVYDNVPSSRSFQAHATRSNAYTSASIDVRHEAHLRYSYCAFLQNLGTRLELPQTTIGTSMVLCHHKYAALLYLLNLHKQPFFKPVQYQYVIKLI